MNENNPYRAAIIGVGKAGGGGPTGGGHAIAHSHAIAYQRQPRVELAAGCDINAENLRYFQDKFQVAGGFADYRQMLRELKPDVVSICTYVKLHRAMLEACAEAGVKGVLCEKPFVASPTELEAIRTIVAESGLKICIAHIRRYLPAFDLARHLYCDGAVGQPVICMAGVKDWDLSEWGSHWLDMFRYFHDDRPVRWVMGQAQVSQRFGYGHAMEDYAVAYFEFDDGGKGLVDGGQAIDGANITLVGTHGVIRIHAERDVIIENQDGRSVIDCAGRICDGWDQLNLASAEHQYIQIWDLLLAGLLDWIDGAPPPRCGLPHTLGSAELNLAVYLSALRGQRIDLPLSSDLISLDVWPVELIKRRTISF